MFAVSQLSSAQNIPYAKTAYLGMAYSDPLQYQRTCGRILKCLSSAARRTGRLWLSLSASNHPPSMCVYGSLYYSCFLNTGFPGPLCSSPSACLIWATRCSHAPPSGRVILQPGVAMRFTGGPYGLVVNVLYCKSAAVLLSCKKQLGTMCK